MGKLTVVDLAGSERIAKTGAAGATLHEGTMINKCLTCLGKVIYALAALNEKQEKCPRPQISNLSTFVPYRDSKLTRVLQDSLGGNSNTCLILTCSQELVHVSESISTLRFGQRAMCVRNSPTVNLRKASEEEERLEQCLSEAKAYIAKLTGWSEEVLFRLAGGGAEHRRKDAKEALSSQLPVSREAGRKAALSSPLHDDFHGEDLSFSAVEELLALFPVAPDSLRLGTNKKEFVARVRHRLQLLPSRDVPSRSEPTAAEMSSSTFDGSAFEVTSRAANDSSGREGTTEPVRKHTIPSDCPDPEWSAASVRPPTFADARGIHSTSKCEASEGPQKSAGQQNMREDALAKSAVLAGHGSSGAASVAAERGTALLAEALPLEFQRQLADYFRLFPSTAIKPPLQPWLTDRKSTRIPGSAPPASVSPPRRSSFSLCPRRRECIAVLRRAVAKDNEFLAAKEDSEGAQEALLAEETFLVWQRLIHKLAEDNRATGWVSQLAGSWG